MRGVQQPGHPRVSGSVVGLVGGSAFVLVNRGALPDPWPVLALVAWVLLAAPAAYVVLLRDQAWRDPARPTPRAGLVYGASVAGMVVGIVVGARLLAGAGREELVPALVAALVGLHFLPFATAFAEPSFRRIGWTLAALGVAGVVLGLSVPVVGPTAAVLAGLAMVGLVGAAALAPRQQVVAAA